MTHYPHAEPITLRWGDQDAIGHVNNAKYFTFMESARMGYFAAIEIDRFLTATTGPALVATNCNFRRQLHYPAQLEVRARVKEIRNRSFVMGYQIIDLGSGELAAEGDGVVAWANYQESRSMELPSGLRTAIGEFEGRSASLE